MSGQQLKYVRTMVGFTVFPISEGMHADVAASLTWRLISAGFIEWDADGRPLCMGRSDSLDLDSRDDDTAAIRCQWGMTEPLVTLTPAMRADAAAIGACIDPMSIETGEPS